MIEADLAKCNRQIVLCRYERLHVGKHSGAFSGDVREVEFFRHTGRFVQ